MRKPVVELTVNNHAGVMSHITGLFSRRAFNIEGILCGPVGDGETSRIFLLVNEDERLPQVIEQIKKLYDVLEVRERDDYDRSIFNRLHEFVEQTADSPATV
jgi:acetolactate synthase-1/3 small subunit